MDTWIVASIVAATVVWAVLRLRRKLAGPPAGSTAAGCEGCGGCDGCPGATSPEAGCPSSREQR